jgi:hypothetical protein
VELATCYNYLRVSNLSRRLELALLREETFESLKLYDVQPNGFAPSIAEIDLIIQEQLLKGTVELFKNYDIRRATERSS